MRLRALLWAVTLLFIPAAASAFTVETEWGSLVLGEGEEGELAITVRDAVGEVEIAWDLDGDDFFDDAVGDRVTISALGLDGPSDYEVRVVVVDSVTQELVTIPIEVRNIAPEFLNMPSMRAVIGREWTWVPEVVDAGGDSYELSIRDEEDMPEGMTFDALTGELSWTPLAIDQFEGEPRGTFQFRVQAEDDDGGRMPADVALTVVENTPPLVQGLSYPDPESSEPIGTNQPFIIMQNSEDPDGDPITYWARVDRDDCFCSPELQESDAIAPEDFATQWRLPNPLDVEPGVAKTYYLERWTNDGLDDSEHEKSLFVVLLAEDGGDGDADADGDADGDGDADDDGGTCAHVAVGRVSSNEWGLFATSSLVALAFIRRRRS